MNKGITPKDEEILKQILSEYPYKFYYYGSRIKGDFTKASDLDILIDTDKELPKSEIEQLKIRFNKSKIPYVVNFSQRKLMNEQFYELIKNSLVEVKK